MGYAALSTYFKKFGIKVRHDGNMGKKQKCKDGHWVMSSLEAKVDNWLFDHDIDHDYEPKLIEGRNYKSDFYANGYFIEIWGITGKRSYESRKKAKREIYDSFKLKLIELEACDFTKKTKFGWKSILESYFLKQTRRCN